MSVAVSFVQILSSKSSLGQPCLIREAPCVSLWGDFDFLLIAPYQEKWWAHPCDLHSEWRSMPFGVKLPLCSSCLSSPIPTSRASPSATQQEGNLSLFSTNTLRRKDLNLKAAGNFRPAYRIWSNTGFLPSVYVCTEWFCRAQSCFCLIVFRRSISSWFYSQNPLLHQVVT